MTAFIGRRKFITLLGGAAAAWPLTASAQQTRVQYRWADGVFERLPGMLAELVRLQPDVITAFGTATRVAYNARIAGTAGNIPLVFSSGYDPIASGLVTSVNRPDNNITGVTSLAVALAAKRVEFLRELVPTASTLAFLVNPNHRHYTD